MITIKHLFVFVLLEMLFKLKHFKITHMDRPFHFTKCYGYGLCRSVYVFINIWFLTQFIFKHHVGNILLIAEYELKQG